MIESLCVWDEEFAEGSPAETVARLLATTAAITIENGLQRAHIKRFMSFIPGREVVENDTPPLWNQRILADAHLAGDF